MRGLTVLYDARCGFCVSCRRWLEGQPQLVPLELLPAGSPEARRRFPTLRHAEPPDELIAIDDAGGVSRGSDAWITCLYALEDYREWSLRLAQPSLRPLARAAFEWLSQSRRTLSRALRLAPEEQLVQTFQAAAPARCTWLPEKGEATRRRR